MRPTSTFKPRKRFRLSRAFSLIELVIVVVIIGIIAAIAIPKMSRGSAGAAESALKGNLAVLRNAIELYNSEHGAFPSGTAANVVSQLTGVTNASGTAGTKNVATGYIYGPYLRKIPPLAVGTKKTASGVKVTSGTTPATPASADTEGWLFNSDTGEVIADLSDAETSTGSATPYNTF